MAEQLTFKQIFRNSAAIDDYHGFFGSLAQGMNSVGCHFLAGSGVSGDQHRIIGPAGLFEPLEHLLHDRGDTQHAAQ